MARSRRKIPAEGKSLRAERDTRTMPLNEIRFGSDYPKLWGQKKAKLVYVSVFATERIEKELIEYDTKKSDGTYYQLPNIEFFLHLVLIGEKGIPFCTLRKFTQENYDDYRSSIEKWFNIQVG
jgi:hypothetical protein